MATSLVTRQTCRVCGSKALSRVLSLGDHRIAGSFNGLQRTVPLELVRCDPSLDERACGLVQLAHTVPPSILYHDYWYRSGVNTTMDLHLAAAAADGATMVGLRGGDLVIDIGSNDGTLLSHLVRYQGVRVMGFEPSDIARGQANTVHDFFSADLALRETGKQQARLVFSIAMIYDLEDPVSFVRDVARVLAHDGLWVVECHYLPTMLERNQYDAIVHEHLEYYSLAVLERMLGEAGLVAVRVELNDVNGGSIRLYVRRADRYQPEPLDDGRLQELRIREFEMGIDDSPVYEDFAGAVETHSVRLRQLCRELVSDGKTIHVYGASTKGNTILRYARINRDLVPYAADRNPEKVGTQTVTGIPIISEADSRRMEPDYYLVLPWHFLPEFREREMPFLERGGKFIVPLPEVAVVEGGVGMPA